MAFTSDFDIRFLWLGDSELFIGDWRFSGSQWKTQILLLGTIFFFQNLGLILHHF